MVWPWKSQAYSIVVLVAGKAYYVRRTFSTCIHWESQLSEKKGWAALEADRGSHTVFLRRTKKNLWHLPHTELATFFSSSLFVCSQSTGEEVDLTGPDANPLGFSMSIQRPSSLVYSTSFTHSISVCLLSQQLSMFPAWYSCLPISLYPLTFYPSLPRCLHLSLSYWFL